MQGSSPRMRGALRITVELVKVERIIPADAGSTRSPCSSMRSGRDHPRGCGEHCHRASVRDYQGGSSPRMRGAPYRQPMRRSSRWIIPADAGSTFTSCSNVFTSWDHPRGCGEHKLAPESRAACAGSSPRMRGAPDPRLDRQATARIIPADAGSTGQYAVDHLQAEDHPRGCGEHLRVSPA